jgi:hypothetical protein
MAHNPISLPLHVEKNIGLSVPMMLGVAAIVILIDGVPLLFSGGPIVDTLLHSTSSFILLFVILMLVFALFVFRTNATLDIDNDGICVTFRKMCYFYAWSDITAVVPVTNALRIDIKDRSEKENQSNLITDRFGIKRDDLLHVINDGMAQWGATSAQRLSDRPGSESGDGDFGIRQSAIKRRTTTPSDDPKATTALLVRTMAPFLAVVFMAMFGWLVFWQASEYNKTVVLQRQGVATNAHVLRYYSDDCTRSGCALDVEYEFQAGPNTKFSGQSFRGHDFLAGDDYKDDEDYKQSVATHSVPIVYDSAKPSTSTLNFGNWVFKRDPLRMMLFTISMVGGMGLLGILTMGLILFFVVRQVRKKTRTTPSLIA